MNTHSTNTGREIHLSVAPIKKTLLTLALVSATALLVTGCNPSGEASAEPHATAPHALPVVEVAPVVEQTITEWDEFTGRLEAPEVVVLRPRVSGYIEKVAFNEGSTVRKGDLLFEIDSRSLRSEVSRLRAELNAVQSRLKLAESDLKRAESLKAQNAISVEQVDGRLAERDQTHAQLEATKAALESAELNLSFTQVKAPISGRVSRALFTEGNYVNAGQSELTTLVSTDTVQAYFDADELTFLKYRAQHPSQASGPGKTYSANKTPVFMRLANENTYPHLGTLDFIDNQVNPQTGTIQVRAVFNNQDQQFTPGLFTRIRLAASPRHSAVLISDRAVGTDLNNKFVLVLSAGDTVEYRGVELGPLVNDMRIVRKGLAPGDQIVVNGLQRVRPGAQVQTEPVAMFSEASLEQLYSDQQVIEARLKELDTAQANMANGDPS